MAQTLAATPGEILDQINCEKINNGAKQKRQINSIDEMLKLR
nr:MAG TPA: hypothetical protein [Caudoviricetes sp.]